MRRRKKKRRLRRHEDRRGGCHPASKKRKKGKRKMSGVGVKVSAEEFREEDDEGVADADVENGEEEGDEEEVRSPPLLCSDG